MKRTIFHIVFLLLTMIVLSAISGTSNVLGYEADKPNFDTYLRKTALEGQGALIDYWSMKYNVDPRLVIAIAGAESNFGNNSNGLNCPAYKNPWNILNSGKCWKFDTYEQSIIQITAQLREYRENRRLLSIKQIGSVYCGSGCENWEKNVKYFYADLGGNPNSTDLTYPYPVGGVDLWQYCSTKWGTKVDSGMPVELRNKKSAYGWYCRTLGSSTWRKIQYKSISVNEACSWQYKDLYVTTSGSGKEYKSPGFIAKASNSKNPYSWQCYYK